MLFAVSWFMISCGNIRLGKDYRTANRASAEIAPDPAKTPEAVVQVYSARAFNWRGIFSLHTWIATKPANAPHYTVHQVVGWRVRRGLPALFSAPDIPDRHWFGYRPEILVDLRGPKAASAIVRIMEAVENYPYARDYTLWPGPNSNTFTAYVGRHVPELGLDMPVTAVGKDFLANGSFVGRAPSGTGFQVSIFGLLGLLVARQEGLEVNLLGLSFGIDPLGPALKLPFIGRLGIDLDRRSTSAK
ncbi:MAG: DUF3750 domain-containing protein [Deltaproteobacteria bacterium]|nr:DUF3750 domain-containing protein [Deltaproteobacteria bacterium]